MAASAFAVSQAAARRAAVDALVTAMCPTDDARRDRHAVLAAATAATVESHTFRDAVPRDVRAAVASLTRRLAADAQHAKAGALEAASGALLGGDDVDAGTGTRLLATLLALAGRPLATPLSAAVLGAVRPAAAAADDGRRSGLDRVVSHTLDSPASSSSLSTPLASDDDGGEAARSARRSMDLLSPLPSDRSPVAVRLSRAPPPPPRPLSPPPTPDGCLARRLGTAADAVDEAILIDAVIAAMARGDPSAGPPPAARTPALSPGAVAALITRHVAPATRAGAHLTAHAAALARSGNATGVALGVALTTEAAAVCAHAATSCRAATLAATALACRDAGRRLRILLAAADVAAGAGVAAPARVWAVADAVASTGHLFAMADAVASTGHLFAMADAVASTGHLFAMADAVASTGHLFAMADAVASTGHLFAMADAVASTGHPTAAADAGALLRLALAVAAPGIAASQRALRGEGVGGCVVGGSPAVADGAAAADALTALGAGVRASPALDGAQHAVLIAAAAAVAGGDVVVATPPTLSPPRSPSPPATPPPAPEDPASVAASLAALSLTPSMGGGMAKHNAAAAVAVKPSREARVPPAAAAWRAASAAPAVAAPAAAVQRALAHPLATAARIPSALLASALDAGGGARAGLAATTAVAFLGAPGLRSPLADAVAAVLTARSPGPSAAAAIEDALRGVCAEAGLPAVSVAARGVGATHETYLPRAGAAADTRAFDFVVVVPPSFTILCPPDGGAASFGRVLAGALAPARAAAALAATLRDRRAPRPLTMEAGVSVAPCWRAAQAVTLALRACADDCGATLATAAARADAAHAAPSSTASSLALAHARMHAAAARAVWSGRRRWWRVARGGVDAVCDSALTLAARWPDVNAADDAWDLLARGADELAAAAAAATEARAGAAAARLGVLAVAVAAAAESGR